MEITSALEDRMNCWSAKRNTSPIKHIKRHNRRIWPQWNRWSKTAEEESEMWTLGQGQGTLPAGLQYNGCEAILSKAICTAEMKTLDLVASVASPLPSDRLETFWFVRQVCLQGEGQMSILVDVTIVGHFGKMLMLKLVLWAWLLCAHYWG